MAKDRRIPLVTLLGFQIRFDLTWLILVALVVWSLSALHQTAAGTWLGGVMCAAVLAVRAPDHPAQWLHRFSLLAAAAVTVLALTGMALSLVYVGAPAAAIGTSYGVMVLTKLVLRRGERVVVVDRRA